MILSPNRPFFIASLLIITCLCFSCSPRMAPYDNYSYTQAVALKTEAMTLIDEATDLYSNHEKEVNDFQAKIDKLFDYELHRDRNDITTDLWFKLKDPKGKLLGAFITRWKKDEKLRPAYVAASKKAIERYFEQIAAFENHKSKK